MSDNYETFVRWYLRFNGYFGVESFITHEPINNGNQQGGETDVLAVRFPFSREEPGFPIINHNQLFDEEAINNDLIDIVIAEVKNLRDDHVDKINKIWTNTDEKYYDRVAYIIRWIGVFQDEATIQEAARELKSKYRFAKDNYLIRFIYFGNEQHVSIVNRGIKQITFREIANFLLQTRTPSFFLNNLGVRSPHNQWDDLIKKIWEIGNPDDNRSLRDQEDSILQLLQKYQ